MTAMDGRVSRCVPPGVPVHKPFLPLSLEGIRAGPFKRRGDLSQPGQVLDIHFIKGFQGAWESQAWTGLFREEWTPSTEGAGTPRREAHTGVPDSSFKGRLMMGGLPAASPRTPAGSQVAGSSPPAP